jgi:hypothetical protein
MPHRLKTHAAVLLGFLAVGICLAAHYVIGQELTKLYLDVLLGASVIVSLTWFPAARDAIRRGANTAGDKIILSIWVSWTALLVQRIYVLGVSITTDPITGQRADWLVTSPAATVVAALILVAGAYTAYATVSDARVPIHERKFVLTATFIGGLIVGFVLACALIFDWHF